LTFGHLGVDTFVVDAGFETEVEVGINDFTGDIAYIAVANAGVVRALGGGVSLFRKPKWATVLIEKILLFKAKPGTRIIQNGGAGVSGMGFAIGQHNLAHDEHPIFLGGIRENCHRFEHTVGTVAFGLSG